MTDPAELTHADWQARAAAIRPETRLFIGGDTVAAASGEVFSSENPATGEPVAEIARAGAADVDKAVAAAKAAFPVWSRMAPRERALVLYRFADLILENAAELALYDSLEAGKPIADLVSYDLPEVATTLRFFAEAADKIEGSVTATPSDVLHYTLREPLGVVGCISPWNYPLLMATWKFAPALAAGNTVVAKPAEEASLSCLRAAALFVEAGGPPGVFNVIAGFGEEAGAPLARHMDVAKISFTGSTAVGRLMLRYAGESNLKKVGLECGGKSPNIFCADLPDLDAAVAAAVEGIFGNMGEVCNAGSRILVARDIYADFVQRFTALSEDTYRPGDPLDPTTAMGPLVNAEAKARHLRHVEGALSEGARRLFGGGAPDMPGHFVEPCGFGDVSNAMTLAREEVFTPLAAIIPFDSVDEAVAIANDTVYGLAAGVWTSDLSTAHRLVRDIEAGVVWVNTFNDGDMTQPFGGYKQSGSARDKALMTLAEYCQVKSAWIRL